MSNLEELIKIADADLRSISWHSDGRVIAKSGANALRPRKLYSAKTPNEAVEKLIKDNLSDARIRLPHQTN